MCTIIFRETRSFRKKSYNMHFKQVLNDYRCGHSTQVKIVELNNTNLTSPRPRPVQSSHYLKSYSGFFLRFLTYFRKSEFLGSHGWYSHYSNFFIPINGRAYWYRSNKLSLSSIYSMRSYQSFWNCLTDRSTDRPSYIAADCS